MTKRKPAIVENTPRLEFAAFLKRCFLKAGIEPSDYAELGELIAEVQEPKRHIPYGDYTIDGWIKGDLLPSDAAQDALERVLSADYGLSDNALELLTQWWDSAKDWEGTQPKQPTELTHALKVAADRAGLFPIPPGHNRVTYKLFFNKIDRWNDTTTNEDAILAKLHSIHGIEGYAKQRPNRHLVDAIAQWTQTTTPPMVPSLHAVHDQMLRERGDIVWEPSAQDGKLSGLINAIRLRLGETFEELGHRIGALHNPDAPPVKAAYFAPLTWCTQGRLPLGGPSMTGETLCEDIVKAARLADIAPTPLARSITEPWFTPEREILFRSLFRAQVADMNAKGNFSIIPPAATVAPPPAIDKIAPSLLVTRASLAGKLMNGCTKKPKVNTVSFAEALFSTATPDVIQL